MDDGDLPGKTGCDGTVTLREGLWPLMRYLAVARGEELCAAGRLTEQEVTVLNSIKERLDAASDHEVEGHDVKII